jgi:hypothetical protein
MIFETLKVKREAAVLFVQICAPPMNLLGPELVRDLVALIQEAEADDTVRVLVFKSADPDYFIAHVDVTRIGEYREAAACKPKASAMVKHPAWAAAISSSGFVLFSFSKRVLNEYGASASTPESVVRLPVPVRPVPCQTALALRIMLNSLV